MLLELAAAYLAIALFAAVRTTRSVRRLPVRPGEHPDRVELGFLWCVAVAASLLWLVFFPVFARGWLHTRVPRFVAALRLRAEARRAARAARVARSRVQALPSAPAEEGAPPQWLLSVSGGGNRPPVAALLPPPPAQSAPRAAPPVGPRLSLRRRRSAG